MSEAACYQMPYSLRRLFATILVYCSHDNPRELWEQFEDLMSEDFKSLANLGPKDIHLVVLNHINDILHSMGRDINEFNLISEMITSSKIANEAKEVYFERNIIVSDEDLLLHRKLNAEQKIACDIILQRVFSNKSGAFFIDGPGGSGKTFLYCALLATVRSTGFVALATTTSGVAASILSGGRTTHSRFKIPINIDEIFSCNISKQSSLASLIRDAKLIVWDEVSMVKKNMIEALDSLLKDIMDTNVLFGGKIIVFGGDFRQTLPVVRSGKKEDFIRQSILNSEIWNELEKLRLSENMRAKTDPSFCEYLMRIGNGTEKRNADDKIEISTSFIVPYITEKESLDLLFNIIYPDLHTSFHDTSFLTSRVILTTKNDFVDELNDRLKTLFPKDAKTFVATDETIEPNDQSQFEDFLHSLNPAGLPPYKLILKENCPIIFLRNLNPCEGLCNGTRLRCCDFKSRVISAKIASGDFKNTHVFIPRIPLLSSDDEKLPIPFKRTQFPLRLCFAMTINKAQGQTLDYVGIYLREPVFSHG
ncbi:uncharacterized protein [Nicotiana tomentosiformis]|uniref:uncharacterized protein n=1 Tax=Nicotiana tomentosiformis TaxID=4098 RepID=UPI00051C7620|nr:ATP-dependent DNA helicase PIF1-like [Nicotiana tomentosiformis]XP_018623090.1 ATP-dependent DNA helicase PIF1-like [Nicotiana tomentosiformis]XP_018623091.1 ATP-dependent DNA helicase PIF1-like [Nicotiana tomentosiformis]